MSPFSVSGMTALISGAASRIGFAAAKALGESGANLILREGIGGGPSSFSRIPLLNS